MPGRCGIPCNMSNNPQTSKYPTSSRSQLAWKKIALYSVGTFLDIPWFRSVAVFYVDISWISSVGSLFLDILWIRSEQYR